MFDICGDIPLANLSENQSFWEHHVKKKTGPLNKVPLYFFEQVQKMSFFMILGSQSLKAFEKQKIAKFDE